MSRKTSGANMAPTARERNRSILQLHEQGVRSAKIALQHKVTPGRISQILSATRAVEKRRAVLERKYGRNPDIARLSDAAPFDVLMLCNSASHGWVGRIRSLCRGQEALKTLGDLRRLTDAELLAKPGLGARLFAQLRAICPYVRSPVTARPQHRRRRISRDLTSPSVDSGL
jgi:hypothetical protein